MSTGICGWCEQGRQSACVGGEDGRWERYWPAQCETWIPWYFLCFLGWDYWGWKKPINTNVSFWGLYFGISHDGGLLWDGGTSMPIPWWNLRWRVALYRRWYLFHIYICMYTQMLHVFTYNYHKDWLHVGIPYMDGMGCYVFIYLYRYYIYMFSIII